jgi:hypothetical protein
VRAMGTSHPPTAPSRGNDPPPATLAGECAQPPPVRAALGRSRFETRFNPRATNASCQHATARGRGRYDPDRRLLTRATAVGWRLPCLTRRDQTTEASPDGGPVSPHVAAVMCPSQRSIARTRRDHTTRTCRDWDVVLSARLGIYRADERESPAYWPRESDVELMRRRRERVAVR